MGCAYSCERRVSDISSPDIKQHSSNAGLTSNTQVTLLTDPKLSTETGICITSNSPHIKKRSLILQPELRVNEDPQLLRRITQDENAPEFSFKGVSESCSSVDAKEMTFFRQTSSASNPMKSMGSTGNSMAKIEGNSTQYSKPSGFFFKQSTLSKGGLNRFDSYGNTYEDGNNSSEYQATLENAPKSAGEIGNINSSMSSLKNETNTGTPVFHPDRERPKGSLAALNNFLLVVTEESRIDDTIRDDSAVKSEAKIETRSLNTSSTLQLPIPQRKVSREVSPSTIQYVEPDIIITEPQEKKRPTSMNDEYKINIFNAEDDHLKSNQTEERENGSEEKEEDIKLDHLQSKMSSLYDIKGQFIGGSNQALQSFLRPNSPTKSLKLEREEEAFSSPKQGNHNTSSPKDSLRRRNSNPFVALQTVSSNNNTSRHGGVGPGMMALQTTFSFGIKDMSRRNSSQNESNNVYLNNIILSNSSSKESTPRINIRKEHADREPTFNPWQVDERVQPASPASSKKLESIKAIENKAEKLKANINTKFRSNLVNLVSKKGSKAKIRTPRSVATNRTSLGTGPEVSTEAGTGKDTAAGKKNGSRADIPNIANFPNVDGQTNNSATPPSAGQRESKRRKLYV